MSQSGTTKSPGRRPGRARVAVVSVVAVVGAFVAPLTPAQGAVAPVGQGFHVTAGDLSFILKQIRISERHAATLTPANPCGTLVGPGPNQIPDRLTSYGLRTVDGSCNNLFEGRGRFGSADMPFPRLTNAVFRAGEPSPPGFPPMLSSSYAQKKGFVYDSRPRTISNLIVDQTATNPAAVAAAGHPVRSQGNPGIEPCTTDPSPADPNGDPDGCTPSGQTLFIPNVTTDVGLSPPYNSLFTFFGQFFDHGVDQTVKSGGTVFIPLKPDDPLVTLGPDHKANTGDEVPPSQAFMVITRAQNQPGPDGVLGDNPATPADESADDIQDANNTDSPWVDQSQTYSSHASHQVFLRDYDNTSGRPVSTGKFLGGEAANAIYPGSPDGRTGISTWHSVKKQAAEKLGLLLTDRDVTNIPMLATDPYGEFIPGPARGLPQYVTKTGLVEGNTAAPVAVPANVVYFDTPFIGDIAHNADPSMIDTNNDGRPDTWPTPDGDSTPSADFAHQPAGTYDDEMLNAHFACGDGRCNENIALSTIHQIFHSEHNRLVDDITATLNDPANADLKTAYQAVNTTTTNPELKTFSYGDRLFQAARFVTEMEYQHLVFEEFARKVVPAIRPFHVYVPDVNPAVQAEFAHAVYRFGHSMLDDDVARTNEDGTHNDLPLLTAFLNPPEYFHNGSSTYTPEQAAGAVVMGSSDQAGNELDEFVVETLRNNLLGLPLDLPAINMTRARDAGIPPLNEVRRQLLAQTQDSQVAPYANWSDFGQHLKHPESLINFVAAYGKHPTITSATTLVGKRNAARAIVDPLPGDVPPADASAFMFGVDGRNLVGCDQPGADCRDWSDVNNNTITGLEEVDLWVGGLAEVTNLFGSLLGSTFNYVFQLQLENLQEGDRFYYLNRTPGMNLRTQLEGNSFAEMIQRNTDGTNTLKADAFATADCKFQLAHLNGTPAGFQQFGSVVADDPTTECEENLLLVRQPNGTIQYKTRNTVDPSGINGQSVYMGTPGTDRVNGGNDNDTFWGADGQDFIEGNGGDDVSFGGNGNDVMTDLDGADVQLGGPGNDAMDAGPGDDLSIGGDGQDFINGAANDNEQFGGEGNDFIISGQGADATFGDGGDDWIEGGSGQDLLIGDHAAPFFDDPAESKPGNDIFIGQVGENDYDAEGGDDLMSQNAAIDRNAGAGGYDWAFHQYDTVGADDDMAINNNLIGIPLPVVVNRDRWQETEGNSGSAFDDVIRGDDEIPVNVGGAGFTGCDALDAAGVARIAGLDAIMPPLTTPLSTVLANSSTGTCPLSGPVWGAGNILLGGGGNDTITGRGGDDIIDGDRYIAVRISVRTNPADPGTEIGSTDLMEHVALTGTFGPGTAGETLQKAVFDGDVDPGNLVAVREVKTAGAGTAIDTAVFRGPRASFNIAFGSGSVTVTDTAGTDGTDTLRGIEKLQFTDQTLDISTAPNAPTIGTATAGDASATVRWTAPAANGSGPLNQYQVQVLVNNALVRTVTGIPANATSTVVNGLTNGTTYTFKVIAVNNVGLSSPPSAASNAVTPNNPAPEVVSSVPANGATGVSLTNDLLVTFDEVVTGIAANSVILLNPANQTVASALSFNTTTRVLTVNPNANLAANTTYRLQLLGTLPNGNAGIRNAANLRLTNTTITFTTVNDPLPTLVSISPANGAVLVQRNANIVLTFSEPVQGVNVAGAVTLRPTLQPNSTPVAGVWTSGSGGAVWTFNPNANLGSLTGYTVTLTGNPAIRDLTNNPLVGTPITRTFSTRL